MLSKAAKNEIVENFSATFKANPSVMVVEYKGLTVGEMEGLRSKLKGVDAELQVVKNTLLKIAAKETTIDQINDLFIGPTAIAVCNDNPASAAKVFVEFAKDKPFLRIKGGVVDGSVVSESDINAISKLPSRKELIGQFIGLLSAPMSNFASTLNQVRTKVLYALMAVKDTKEESAVEDTKEENAVEDTKEENAVEDTKEENTESE